MAAPQGLVDDVRIYRCVGLIDSSKSAQLSFFGLLRNHIIAVGTFEARGDVSRLYYSDDAVNDVVRAIDCLGDYRDHLVQRE